MTPAPTRRTRATVSDPRAPRAGRSTSASSPRPTTGVRRAASRPARQAAGGGPAGRRASRTGGGSGFLPLGAFAAIGSAARYRRDLARLARVVEGLRGGPVEIEVQALSDAEIRRVNRQFLGHDWATDVVSFPLSPPEAPCLVGSLAVSRDTACREAARRGHSPYDEWMLYVVHGTLHLLGHDDQAPRARARMRRAEADVLAALGRPHVFGAAPGRRGGRSRHSEGTTRTSEAR